MIVVLTVQHVLLVLKVILLMDLIYAKYVWTVVMTVLMQIHVKLVANPIIFQKTHVIRVVVLMGVKFVLILIPVLSVLKDIIYKKTSATLVS